MRGASLNLDDIARAQAMFDMAEDRKDRIARQACAALVQWADAPAARGCGVDDAGLPEGLREAIRLARIATTHR